MNTSYDTETCAIHLLLPRDLVSSLDMHRNRYTTRTSLIAHAIERYVASLPTVDNAPKLKLSAR